MITSEQQDNRMEYWKKTFDLTHYETHPIFWKTFCAYYINLKSAKADTPTVRPLHPNDISDSVLSAFMRGVSEMTHDETNKIDPCKVVTYNDVAFCLPSFTGITFSTQNVLVHEFRSNGNYKDAVALPVYQVSDPEMYGVTVGDLLRELNRLDTQYKYIGGVPDSLIVDNEVFKVFYDNIALYLKGNEEDEWILARLLKDYKRHTGKGDWTHPEDEELHVEKIFCEGLSGATNVNFVNEFGLDFACIIARYHLLNN